jgi:hypothetical protein
MPPSEEIETFDLVLEYQKRSKTLFKKSIHQQREIESIKFSYLEMF